MGPHKKNTFTQQVTEVLFSDGGLAQGTHFKPIFHFQDVHIVFFLEAAMVRAKQ